MRRAIQSTETHQYIISLGGKLGDYCKTESKILLTMVFHIGEWVKKKCWYDINSIVKVSAIKNPAYGTHRLSRRVRIVAQIL